MFNDVIMAQLSIHMNISSDVLNAIQTILNVFASKCFESDVHWILNYTVLVVFFSSLAEEKKDRDCLLDRIKVLEAEKLEYSKNFNVDNTPVHSITSEANQRKRIKTDFDDDDYTIQDTSKDELNAAFQSSLIEDYIVEPTPCQRRFDPDQSKIDCPSHTASYEANKENQNKNKVNTNDKSPTVLSKSSKKKDVNMI